MEERWSVSTVNAQNAHMGRRGKTQQHSHTQLVKKTCSLWRFCACGVLTRLVRSLQDLQNCRRNNPFHTSLPPGKLLHSSVNRRPDLATCGLLLLEQMEEAPSSSLQLQLLDLWHVQSTPSCLVRACDWMRFRFRLTMLGSRYYTRDVEKCPDLGSRSIQGFKTLHSAINNYYM